MDELRPLLRKAVMGAMHDNPSSYLEHGDTADHIVSVVIAALARSEPDPNMLPWCPHCREQVRSEQGAEGHACDWPGCQGQCHTGGTCPCHPTPAADSRRLDALRLQNAIHAVEVRTGSEGITCHEAVSVIREYAALTDPDPAP